MLEYLRLWQMLGGICRTMAYVWCYSITAVCFVSLLVRPAGSERYFKYRDHRDQRKLQHMGALSVHNKREAEEQLEKYGYLTCRIPFRHKRSFFPEVNFEGFDTKLTEGNIPLCNKREVRRAIKQYQKTYKLPETGILDKETKRLMSASRCGNTDKDEIVEVIENKKQTHKTKLQLKESISKKTSELYSHDSWGSKFKSRPWKRKRSVSNTNLLNIIAGKDRTPSAERRRQYLHEYIDRLKTDDPYMLKSDTNSEIIKVLSRSKRMRRSVAVMEHIENITETSARPRDNLQKFEKQTITWRLLETGYSTRIPAEEQRATIDLAFRMWSEVIPLNFVEVPNGDILKVDIEVAFGRGAHQNCKRDFDGHGGEIAHSFSTGNMHFDDDEYFKSSRSLPDTADGIYLLRVAVHEIGHVLGLIHTDKKYSIMYAIYEKEKANPDFELGWEDRKAVQRVYGVCKGRFNTVFDWVRQKENGEFIYNTYFFRDNHYWMYENHANRTRYGDPLYIAREWGGVPNEPDGYAHVWFSLGNIVVNDAYFYKGEFIYKYNNDKDELYEGWPKLIADVYKPLAEDTKDKVPDNLDTVFFDMRDKNIYFFKDDMIFVYDPKVPEEDQGCCLRKVKLQDEYPTEDLDHPLPGNLDAVYYSYKDRAMYLIKDEDVWQNTLFHPRQKTIVNSVKYMGKWYEKWFDICDATSHTTFTGAFYSHR